jgi:hypothetical protein
MATPTDRAETALTCPTCGHRSEDPLELRTHELEMHGGEGPGSGMPDQDDQPRPSAGGSVVPSGARLDG